jgi:hypothetical protein
MMKNSLLEFKLITALFRTLVRVMDALSRFSGYESLDNDRSSLLGLGPVDERRLTPAPVPILRSRR